MWRSACVNNSRSRIACLEFIVGANLDRLTGAAHRESMAAQTLRWRAHHPFQSSARWFGRTHTPISPCDGFDRPSWPTGFLPHRTTPITLPAACLPLVLFGAPVPQIPCWHGPQQSPPQMPDIRLQAIPQQPQHQSVSCPWGGVHIGRVRALCFEHSRLFCGGIHQRSSWPTPRVPLYLAHGRAARRADSL